MTLFGRRLIVGLLNVVCLSPLPANAGASKADDGGYIPNGMVRCWNGQLAPIRRSYDDPPVCPPIPESKQCSRPTVEGPDGLMHCPEDVRPYIPGKDQSETKLKTSPPPGCSGGNCDRNPHQDLSRPPEWAHRKIDPDLSPRGSWSYGVFVVYEGGSNDLYQESYLVAYLEDGHGNPACEGIVARIVNTSHKYPARVGLYGETSFVVRPQKMIELPLYQYRSKRDHRWRLMHERPVYLNVVYKTGTQG
jgi:hypothetical protein